MEASSGRSLLDPFRQGTRKRIDILADKVSRHYCSRFSAPDCIEKEWYPQGGAKTLYQRVSTPRPAPKIVLKDVWKLQQQHGTLSSSGKPLAEQQQGRPTSSGKPLAEENHLKLILAVLEDQGRMTKIQELVDKLRPEYRAESVVADMRKEGLFNRFSEKSKRTIQRLGNIEWHELEKITKTQACSQYPHVEYASCPRRNSDAESKSIRDLVYSVLLRENGLLTRSETWTEPLAI